uniref:Periplasmic protein n=1 Tax=uncultured Helicobacter sp. TaxID=175537 RepID=A0A650EL79_9HELI|nr:hypothetical protein Helico4rc_1310 [uncultured Helicobacter sp.]
MRILCILAFLCLNIALCNEWVMFSDGKDTYIYNAKSGEIYIRHSMGKANYEDVFVKMPRGAQPSEIKNGRFSQNNTSNSSNTSLSVNTDNDRIKQMQLDAIKKSQEMLNSALE